MESLISKWKNTVDVHNKKLQRLRDASSETRPKQVEKVRSKIKDSDSDRDSSFSDEKTDKSDPNVQDLMP